MLCVICFMRLNQSVFRVKTVILLGTVVLHKDRCVATLLLNPNFPVHFLDSNLIYIYCLAQTVTNSFIMCLKEDSWL